MQGTTQKIFSLASLSWLRRIIFAEMTRLGLRYTGIYGNTMKKQQKKVADNENDTILCGTLIYTDRVVLIWQNR